VAWLGVAARARTTILVHDACCVRDRDDKIIAAASASDIGRAIAAEEIRAPMDVAVIHAAEGLISHEPLAVNDGLLPVGT